MVSDAISSDFTKRKKSLQKWSDPFIHDEIGSLSVNVRILGVGLDKGTPRRNIIAH